MVESVRDVFSRGFNWLNLDRAQQDDGILQRDRWGFRYDPSHIRNWQRIAQEQSGMYSQNPAAFQIYLNNQPPCSQYAVLEIISQKAFGVLQGDDRTPHVQSCEVGDLYTGLIRHHFSLPILDEPEDRHIKQRNEFRDNIWRLTIPPDAVTRAVINIIPQFHEMASYSKEFIPYMQQVVSRMPYGAKDMFYPYA